VQALGKQLGFLLKLIFTYSVSFTPKAIHLDNRLVSQPNGKHQWSSLGKSNPHTEINDMQKAFKRGILIY